MNKKSKSNIRSSMIGDEQSDAVSNMKKHMSRSQSFHQAPKLMCLIKQSVDLKHGSYLKLNKQATKHDSAVKI